jgi:hypothetical protein
MFTVISTAVEKSTSHDISNLGSSVSVGMTGDYAFKTAFLIFNQSWFTKYMLSPPEE